MHFVRKFGLSLVLSLFALLFVVTGTPSFAANEMSLTPVADTYVNSSSPNQNYGSQQNLLSDKNKTIYMRYDLRPQAGQQLVSAKLRIYVSDSSSATFNLKNVSNTSWQESALTYNTRPSAGSAFKTFSNSTRGTWKEVDITSYIQTRLGQIVTIAIDNSSGNSDSVAFNSRENTTNKPQLVLQMNTPLPTSTPAPIAAPSPTPTPTQSAKVYPAQVLDLTNWKIQLPIGEVEKPTEVKQPTLATYKIDPWFVVAPGGNAVQFRAPVNGVTTSGSNYPRSELREMVNGTTNAAWVSSTGTHTLFIDQAVTALPATKNQIVVGQIHDATQDVIVIRLQGPKLFIKIGDLAGPTLDANYTLGKRFTVKFVVNNDQTSIYYNGSTTPAYTLNQAFSGAYFKAGAYTQSNCSTEAANLCTANNYGEAYIYNIQVTHQ